MAKPKGKIKIQWSPNFAYAIGLLVTDGCLSKDGRHIDFTSKDLQQIKNFCRALQADLPVRKKTRDKEKQKKYYHVQFSDVLFYRFLLSIGLMPNKTKRLIDIQIPDAYFFDFLRGHFDGDGTFYSYWDPRWRSSFMFYTAFVSASKPHMDWLRLEIHKRLGIYGHLNTKPAGSIYQLKYAKRESTSVLRAMYHSREVMCLKRKLLKISRVLSILPSP